MKNNRLKYIILIFLFYVGCEDIYGQCYNGWKHHRRHHHGSGYPPGVGAGHPVKGSGGGEEYADDDWGGDDGSSWGDDDDDDGGGGSSAGVQDPNKDPRCFELIGETELLPNKDRKIVGIGEVVIVTPVQKKYENGKVIEVIKSTFCDNLFKWTIINESGTEAYFPVLDPPDEVALTKGGGSIKVKSGFVPGKYTIRCDYLSSSGKPECPQSCPYQVLYYEVIAPKEVVYYEAKRNCGVPHLMNKPSAEMKLRLFLKPETVNFSNVRIKETEKGDKNEWDNDISQNTYHVVNPQAHHDEHIPSDEWVKSLDSVIPSLGTEVEGFDNASMSFECSKSVLGANPNFTGFHQWTIPYVYERLHRNYVTEEIPFCEVIQRAENIKDTSGKANPKFILSKGGINLPLKDRQQVTTELKSASTCGNPDTCE